MSEDRLAAGAAALRRAFDRSFADPPSTDTEASADLLLIRVAEDPYAIGLEGLAGVFLDRAVTPLPTRVPGLLGVAGFRAMLLPVYDLRALLGHPGGDALRWMVTTSGDSPVGLVFDRFEQHLRAPRGAIAPDDSGARGHVRQVVRTTDGARPVIHLPSVLEAIKERALSAARSKER